MSNDDLVPRLRVLSGCTEEGYEADIIQKAADRIEALEARVAELERALRSAAPPINVITIGEEGGGHDIVVEGWRFPPQGLRLTDQRDFDCAGELARENARLRAAMAWQPIETAPRDGTNIMLWHKVWKCPVSAFYGETYRKDCPWTQTTNTTIWPEEAFTHWMPLPTAPEGE